jgi:hypothetical protein
VRVAHHLRQLAERGAVIARMGRCFTWLHLTDVCHQKLIILHFLNAELSLAYSTELSSLATSARWFEQNLPTILPICDINEPPCLLPAYRLLSSREYLVLKAAVPIASASTVMRVRHRAM